jgi:lysophospholipase L1-like esterase
MAKLKIAALGDSLAQGFQSGAIWNTGWSYPAIVARSLGLAVPADFRVPSFGGPGLPFNIERLLYDAELAISDKPSDFELAVRLPLLIQDFISEVEDYYERGEGAALAKFGGSYHNLAVWGFALADALRLTAARAQQAIDAEEGWIEDDFLGLPSGSMYRTARKVFNPKDVAARRQDTQLLSLQRLLETDGPIDVLFLWLGANDALGTVLDLEIRDMTGVRDLPKDPVQLAKWNLTSEAMFRSDYSQLARQVDELLQRLSPQTRVFVGNVPHVTIPPITRGSGKFEDGYFEQYRRFFVRDSAPTLTMERLTRKDARQIDLRIDTFNLVIQEQLQARPLWYGVDTCALLDELAVRRNDAEADPGQRLRQYCERRGRQDHPLLALKPIPSILMYDVKNGARTQGGLMSLDGVHPSTIGYGLIAELFLEHMQAAGIPGSDPRHVPWDAVIENDQLLMHPPRLWEALQRFGQRYSLLWGTLARALA